ncbi:Tetratricopeptide repeat protein, partial [human gut metagenome]
DEVLLAGFSILINNKDADFNLIEDNAIGLSRRNDNIKKEIEAIVGNIGTDAYMNKNFNMAEKYYYLLYRLNNNMCLNIAYMIRRKEVKNANIYPASNTSS